MVVDYIRCLSTNDVQKTDSGHSGTSVVMAPIAYALWAYFSRYDPTDAQWINHNGSVLFMGHSPMLLSGLLHPASVRHVEQNGEVLLELAISLDATKEF